MEIVKKEVTDRLSLSDNTEESLINLMVEFVEDSQNIVNEGITAHIAELSGTGFTMLSNKIIVVEDKINDQRFIARRIKYTVETVELSDKE